MEAEASKSTIDLEDTQAVAALEHLTGPSRGTVSWLWQPEIELGLRADGRICMASDKDRRTPEPVARLKRSDSNHYSIEAIDGLPLWINGQPASAQLLRHHDMIEFGENGPMSRYYLYANSRKMHDSVASIFSDTAAYFRNSRRPVAVRLMRSCSQTARRLTRDTTVLFRIAMLISIAALGFLVFQQYRMNELQRLQIESGVAELEHFSRVLARSRQEAITPEDLDTLQSDFESRIGVTSERVSEIERRSTASTEIIAATRSAVVFIQGAYGFRNTTDGRMLRQVIGPDGAPLTLPNGLPLLSLEGDGPVAERQFTGSGFFVGSDHLIVTNRHVGVPWQNDANIETLGASGLEPVMIRFIAYAPGVSDAMDLSVVRVSETADIALLETSDLSRETNGLVLSEQQALPGDAIILMGYPTGLKALLVQAGSRFVEDLKTLGETGFWDVAAHLAESGHIEPLASRGIVARVSEGIIAYDAETTRGGSGGPVLDINGEVIAVNSAILPEYGGSNLGVPASEVRKLLEAPSN